MNRDERLERDLKSSLRARAASPCPGEEVLLAFYRGGLSEAESESVREHLAVCASCVRLARDARAFLEAMKAPTAADDSHTHSLRWLAAAAVFAVALLAGLWVARQRPAPAPGPAPEAAISEPANPWRDLPVTAAAYRLPAPEDELVFRSAEEAPPAAFAAAMTPYARGDYAAAEIELGRFLKAHPGHGEASFYRGVSLLMLRRPAEARPLLESAAASSRPPTEARWYRALALLKSGEAAEALAPLDAIGREPGPHQAEAAELADEVRRVRDTR